MNTYGITFKDGSKTIAVEAECFDIRVGFLSLYTYKRGFMECFAAYDLGNIMHCVEQSNCTAAELKGES